MKRSAWLVLLGAQLAIGAAAIFARLALHGTGPVAASALRLTIAALPLLLVSRGWVRVPRHHEFLLFAAGGALAVHFAAWITSLQYTTVGVSTLLVCTSPVWTALYDIMVLRRSVSVRFWLWFGIAIVGVALTCSGHSSPPPVMGHEDLGEVLALTGGLVLGLYLIAIRSITPLYPTMVLVGRTYSWAALILIVMALGLGQSPPGADAMSWTGILCMALVSQLLGHTGLNSSLRWFPSTTVATSTLLEPLFAGVLAALVFGERLGATAMLGGVLVLTSLVPIMREGSGGRQNASS